MKLEKSNKYKGLKTKGLIALVMGTLLLSSGCISKSEAAKDVKVSPIVTSTPYVTLEPTPTLAPTPTPSPTPTPTPSPTPIVELSMEEEIELLNTQNTDYSSYYSVGGCYVVEYMIKGERKIAFVIPYVPYEDDETLIFGNYFSHETMFSTPYDNLINGGPNDLSLYKPNEEIFGDNEVIVSWCDCVCYLEERLDTLNIEHRESEHSKKIAVERGYRNYVKFRQMEEYYVTIVPKQYRVTSAELNPVIDMEETPKVK